VSTVSLRFRRRRTSAMKAAPAVPESLPDTKRPRDRTVSGLGSESVQGARKYDHVEDVASQMMCFQEYYEQEKRDSRARLTKTGNREFQEKRV